ncbi:hypothetical protein [Pseudorhodoplanes sp.]|uniref:hypothetical protein n=1 Tax=Pseudorhodoplanes sp. TaxID=1934341 RepID=UPI003D0FA185
MSQALKQLADGSWVPVNDGDVIRDGERIRVGMPFLDGAGKPAPQFDAANQRPRQGQSDALDTVRSVCARAKMIERQQNAWKDSRPSIPAASAVAPQVQQPIAQVTSDGGESEAYKAYKRRIEDGYKTRVSDRRVAV